ncbi:MAG: hypothetical protein RLY31_1384 [Bacteroidota bacterium]|jgi:tetratricopeptide (TPR) repeat protein
MNPVYDSVLLEDILKGVEVAQEIKWEGKDSSYLNHYLPRAYNNLSLLSMLGKRYEDAEAYLKQGLAITDKYPEESPVLAVQLRNSYCVLLNELGRPDECIAMSQTALELLEGVDNKSLVSTVLSYQGSAHELKQEYDKAFPLFQDMYRLSAEIDFPPGCELAAEHIASY